MSTDGPPGGTHERYCSHMAPQKWASGYSIAWTPILTFTRRRLQLLDWLEVNVEPVSFMEDADQVGFAILDPGLRVLVNRSHLRITVDSAELDVTHLTKAIDGVLETLAPQDAVFEVAASSWSVEIEDADYNEERARVAAKLAGGPKIGDSRPFDSSVLMDFVSPECSTQLEWGIVDAAELVERVKEPRLGRMRRILRPPHSDRLPEHVPQVALFADVVITRTVGGQVRSSAELISAVHDVDEMAGTIAGAVFLAHLGRDEHELAQSG